MNTPSIDSAQQNSGLRDRRRAVVEAATDLFGLDHARLERSLSGDLLLELHFIPGADGRSGRPPRLEPEQIQLMNLETGSPAPFAISALRSGKSPWVVELLLDGLSPGHGPVENGVFQARIVNRKDMDSHFRAVDFGVGVARKSADLRPSETAVSGQLPPPTNYLYKDQESFRGLILDRLARSVPGWQERSPADIGVTLTEAVAHALDLVSYYQDAVGTESYIDTARQRQSIRRHGRLVGVPICDGAGARTWLSFTCDREVVIPKDARVGTTAVDGPIHPDFDAIFRTCHATTVYPEQNQMTPHCWGMAPLTMAAGSTVLALKGHLKTLHEGAVVTIETSATRHPVRISRTPVLATDDATGEAITIIHWSAKDALTQDIIVDDRPNGMSNRVSGNMVLAKQGRVFLVPDSAIIAKQNTIVVELDNHHILGFGADDRTSAASMQRQSVVGTTLPDIQIIQTNVTGRKVVWTPVQDLLSSSPVDTVFVVERDNRERLHIRFGDGYLGRPMPAPNEMEIYVGLGQELSGNVAEDSLAHIHTFVHGLRAVRNPVPAIGGRKPESIESARRRVMRGDTRHFACVEPNDFAELAKQVPGVRDAKAVSDWAGTWPVVTIYLLADNMDAPVDTIVDEVHRLAEAHRRIGMKVEVLPAPMVHVDMEFLVTVSASAPLVAVENRIRQQLGEPLGLFKRDQWGFGEVPFESQLIQIMSAVDGVLWTETQTFRRRDRSESNTPVQTLSLAPHEVIAFEQRHLQLTFEVGA